MAQHTPSLVTLDPRRRFAPEAGAPPPGRRNDFGTLGQLVGDPVHNRRGELLGRIDEVLVDVAAGRMAYALMRWGGFMGIGERLLVLPWSALAFDAEQERVTLDADRARLDGGPCLEPGDALPPPHGPWHLEVHRHYGATPYWLTE